MSGLMRQPQGYWPHFAALGYVAAGYPAGLRLLLAEPVALNLLGTALLAHTLVIAAYLIHECAHNTVCASARHNAWLGEALGWSPRCCGASPGGCSSRSIRPASTVCRWPSAR